jgi:hypothetical protein
MTSSSGTCCWSFGSAANASRRQSSGFGVSKSGTTAKMSVLRDGVSSMMRGPPRYKQLHKRLTTRANTIRGRQSLPYESFETNILPQAGRLRPTVGVESTDDFESCLDRSRAAPRFRSARRGGARRPTPPRLPASRAHRFPGSSERERCGPFPSPQPARAEPEHQRPGRVSITGVCRRLAWDRRGGIFRAAADGRSVASRSESCYPI